MLANGGKGVDPPPPLPRPGVPDSSAAGAESAPEAVAYLAAIRARHAQQQAAAAAETQQRPEGG